jgi:hypothetical protein
MNAMDRPARHAATAVLTDLAAVTIAAEAPKAAVEHARRAPAESVDRVRSELVEAIEASGPLRAIVVCKYTVPEIASAISRKDDARVTRVSPTPRSPPLGWGDAWERKVSMDFDERVARGEKAEGMEPVEITREPLGEFLRDMRVLPMQPACVHCHGPSGQITESVRSQLAHDDPRDRATGLALGKVRGAMTDQKPL